MCLIIFVISREDFVFSPLVDIIMRMEARCHQEASLAAQTKAADSLDVLLLFVPSKDSDACLVVLFESQSKHKSLSVLLQIQDYFAKVQNSSFELLVP